MLDQPEAKPRQDVDVPAKPGNGKSPHRTDWFHAAKWGVPVHILADAASNTSEINLSTDDWNRRIDGIDVDGMARQLAEVKAGYAIITVGQNSGFYLSPNANYDRIVGHSPSRCSRRDLVADLQQALAPYDIPVIAYLPTAAPLGDPLAIRRLRCTPPWDASKIYMPPGRYSPEEGKRTDARLSEFQRNWEAIVGEWSERWGRKVRGWWFDGVYCADLMYRHADEPNFASFARAARRGNPDSILTWNPGVLYPPISVDAEEDYTAGEINDPDRIDSPGRWVGHEQFHVLSFMGKWWGQGPLRFTKEQVIAYTRAVTDYDGVFSWDVPFQVNGLLTDEVMITLAALAKAIEPTRGMVGRTPLKLAQAAMTVPVSPLWDGKENAPGRLTVTLTNPWEVPVSGEIRLGVVPAMAARLELEHIAYALAPQGKTEHVCDVRLLQQPEAGMPIHLCLKREPDPRHMTCLLPWHPTITMPAVGPELPEDALTVALAAQAACLFKANGRLLAEVRWAVHGTDLTLRANVRDAAMRLTKLHWDGSCLEVFVAAADGTPIGQLVLTPATSTVPAEVWRVTANGLVPAPHVSYGTSTVDGGYTAAARIPLFWLLGVNALPETFMIELAVTTGISAETLTRATLFNSINPSGVSARYAVARVEQMNTKHE